MLIRALLHLVELQFSLQLLFHESNLFELLLSFVRTSGWLPVPVLSSLLLFKGLVHIMSGCVVRGRKVLTANDS